MMQQMVGINGLATWAGRIIHTIHPQLSEITPFTLNSSLLVTLITTGFFLFKAKRKPVLLLGNFVLGVFNIAVAVLFYYGTW